MDDIYLDRPNLYIGFHGCEKKVGIDLILHPNRIHMSAHDYEWLGHGFYVWENNYDRALDWASNHYPKFKESFAIGVVYTLEKCLDLTDKHFVELLSKDYPEFLIDLKRMGAPIPQNTDLKGKPNPSGVLRYLDCFFDRTFAFFKGYCRKYSLF